LHTFANIEGRTQLLYSRLEDHRGEFGPEGGIVERLYRRSLDGSDEVLLIPVGGYEWGTHTISYYGDLIVTTQSSEGWVAPYIVSVTGASRFAQYPWVDECATQTCEQPKGRAHTEAGALYDLVIRDDGAEFAWLESTGFNQTTASTSVALVVGAADGTNRRRVELGDASYAMSLHWKGVDRLVIDVSQVGAVGIQRYNEAPARLSLVATVRSDGIDLRLLPHEGHAR
jgi:hypothetical protein